MAAGKLLFRPEEAADALGISRSRLYELMSRGELGSVQIGASRRVPVADLEAYVARLRSQSGAEPTDSTRAPATAAA